MARHVHHRTPDQPAGSGRLLRRALALIIAVTTLMMAAPASMPAAAQDAPGSGAIEVHVSECPPGYAGTDAYGDCHANGLAGVGVQVAGPTTDAKTTEGGVGAARFAGIPAGAYTISLDLPAEGQTYRTYCSLEGEDTQVPMTPANTVPGAVDLAEGQVIICDLYVIPAAEATDPAPTETEEAVEPLASVTANVVTCPEGTDPEGGFDALDAACTAPAENVTLTWGTADGPITSINTTDDDPANGEDGQVIFDEIQPGSYLLVSDVPLEAATEVLYCVADEGDRYQKEFDESGITTFEGIQAEQIVCDWFIVPADLQGDPTDDPVVTPTPGGTEPAQPTPDSEDQRGVESGASLVVHLSLCPVEYDGDDLYGDCHGEGIADQEFVLTGPDGEVSEVTTVPQSPGPGIVGFTELPAGDYTLMGGPPGDFGSVELYCTTQPNGDRIDATVESSVATFAIGEGEDILCDWYYIPVNARGDTPTPTPEPARAEILVTLYACEPGASMAGASYGDFSDACTETVDDVPFTLGDPGAPPLTANTGASGPGAVRFYDLLPADYTLTPSLPGDLGNAAVFCRIDGGDAYQKTITNGSTTFVNVDGESIACDWFASQPAPAPEPPQGPTGSVTVREFLCEKDANEVTDWERECKAGTSAISFTLASTDGAITLSSATNASGVATFTELPDGFYTLKQAEGLWCKAKAERVDSQSRVIVEGGQNTDVFVYQCGKVTDLPSTGTGTGIQPMEPAPWWESLTALQVALMGVGALGALLLAGWTLTRRLRV